MKQTTEQSLLGPGTSFVHRSLTDYPVEQKSVQSKQGSLKGLDVSFGFETLTGSCVLPDR